MDQNALETFKDITAATMRALAHHKNVDVQFTGSETPDKLSNPSKDKALLPLPPHTMDKDSQTLIRAAADIKALYLWHHDAKLHHSLSPNHPIGQAIFETLEKARYEALGSKGMNGVAYNLRSLRQEIFARKNYDLPEEDAWLANAGDMQNMASLIDCLYSLAQNSFLQDSAPEELKLALDYWKPWLDKKLESTDKVFQDLSEHLEDQKTYAEAVKNILTKLDMDAPASGDTTQDDAPQQDQETEDQQSAQQNAAEEKTKEDEKELQGSQETQQTEIDETSENEQARDMASDGSQDTDEDMPAGGTEPPPLSSQTSPSDRYFIYTTKFDEIVDAHELADSSELHLLRTMLDSQMQNMQGLVSRYRQKIDPLPLHLR